MVPVLNLTQREARAFARRATRLTDPPAATVPSILAHHGYIQLDPLNICGRIQDLMLRNRVPGYEEGELLRTLHGQKSEHPAIPSKDPSRMGFEHYLPGLGILAAWPREAYPFIRAYLERIHPSVTRRPFTGAERILAEEILREIGERGPLMSDDLTHEGRSQTAWGSYGRLTKIVLEKLFAAGEVLISERRGFRRVYDLASRVLPPVKASEWPSPQAVHRWRTLLAVRQRRLVYLRRVDLEELSDVLQPVWIEGEHLAYCLQEDLPLLETMSGRAEPQDCVLLSPLDPLIYNRKLTRALWNFDYTWEVYTPASTRKRGYYSLPVLAGLELVGDVEPKADRSAGRLRIASRRVKRGYSTTAALRGLGAFLGLDRPG